MADVKEIIEINISRETKGVSRQGFGVPLFLGNTPAFSTGESVRTYTSPAAVLADFAETDPEYIAANKFFSQKQKPTHVKIGHHSLATNSADVVVTVANSTIYTLTVDSVDVTYTSDVDATAQEIVDGLEADFVTAAAPGTFQDNADGTFTILPNDPNNFTISGTAELAITEDIDSLTDAIRKVSEQDSDWYFITAYTHDPEDMLEIAAYVEPLMAIYGTSYSAVDALTAGVSTDPGSRLQALGYNQTFILYAEDESEFPECAIIGLQAPKDPGSSTWKFKEVTGVTPSNLTTTQSIVLKGTKFDFGKGYNTYEPTGGRTMFAEGRMVSSEFIDIIRFSHWVQARMSERVFMSLMNSEKIPYTASGFAIIEGHMRAVLNDGVVAGGLESYTIEVPNPRSLDPNLRANRVAEGFKFSGILQGATHFIGIQGELTI